MAQAASGRSVEASGRTVEAAIEAALARLGRTAAQVDVQILREPSRGVLGFGAHDAIVRVTEKGADGYSSATVETIAADDGDEGEVDVTWEKVIPAYTDADDDSPFDEDDFDDGDYAQEETPAPIAADVAMVADEVEDEERAVTPAAAPVSVSQEELLEIGREVLVTILQKMRLNADVLASWSEPYLEEEEPALLLEVVGDDLGLLIGRRGETLRDLQYIVRLIVSKRIGGISNIVVDVEEYKARRERTLRQLARRMAERVIATGRPVHMEPMNSYERRIIHMELQTLRGIYTQSSGEGERRKVGIYPGTHRS